MASRCRQRLIRSVLRNVAVEGVSKCDFAMSRDVACRVSIILMIHKMLNIK